MTRKALKSTDRPLQGHGQAFILHIYDSMDCRIDETAKEWSEGWKLVNYLTHGAGRPLRMLDKLEWLAYVASF